MQLWHNLYGSLEKYIIIVNSEEIGKQIIKNLKFTF